jgi:hypothetical protein
VDYEQDALGIIWTSIPPLLPFCGLKTSLCNPKSEDTLIPSRTNVNECCPRTWKYSSGPHLPHCIVKRKGHATSVDNLLEKEIPVKPLCDARRYIINDSPESRMSVWY